ncbi:MAG TPA: hypothetical protein PLI62_10890 [Spirochaetota bacterium]|nr:hypothetical protein [Spirochaetota bacterium]
MKILIVFFSRTGFTEKLVHEVRDSLERRGHIVTLEKLYSLNEKSCIGEICKDVHHYPFIFFSLFSSAFRRYYLRSYVQVEDDISPLKYPDISEFDCICIAGPKWSQVSYPVARYLRIVEGIEGKSIGCIYTFGGPPFPVFELEMFDESMKRIVQARDASIITRIGVSSAYHELGIAPLFRILSRIRLCKPITSFTLGSDYSNAQIGRFCDTITKEKEKKNDYNNQTAN